MKTIRIYVYTYIYIINYVCMPNFTNCLIAKSRQKYSRFPSKKVKYWVYSTYLTNESWFLQNIAEKLLFQEFQRAYICQNSEARVPIVIYLDNGKCLSFPRTSNTKRPNDRAMSITLIDSVWVRSYFRFCLFHERRNMKKLCLHTFLRLF